MDTDVLIVGAGPVGLALAVELGQRGVACRVVERNDRVGYSPRAKMTNVRTREHLRRWGLADALRAASAIPAEYPANVVFATRMDGHVLARFADSFNCTTARNDLYSEGGQWVPQYTLEEVLRVAATALPSVRVDFDTVLTDAVADADGVTSTLECAGTQTIRSRYLVGADGARSAVRRLIGVKMDGPGAIAANLNVVFRSRDLDRMQRLGPAIMYWMVNGDVPALLGPMSGDGLYFFMATKIDAAGGTSDAEVAALIRRSTGLPIDVDIMGTDPWVAHQLIADRYSGGRVYLAGDACHLHPPFGGFGMNMGVGDAVDLGWKLAATLQGWGGPALLPSYEAERRPVHAWAVAEALANYATVGNQLTLAGIEDPGPGGDATRREAADTIATTKIREIRSLGTVKGYSYGGSPIVVPDGTPAPVRQGMAYIPSAHPGCVAPHLWLADGTSLYDHFGAGFSVLVTRGDGEDALALCQTAERRGIPMTRVQPGDPRLPTRYGATLAVIRPDQHVAWRGDTMPADLNGLLDQITGQGGTNR